MKLSELVKNGIIEPGSVPGILRETPFSAISSDSRTVKPGTLFIAVKGHEADGHNFIDQALGNGAPAVIAQENPGKRKRVLLVKDSRTALAHTAALFFGHPSKEMTLVGVTGTNGKTTISWILESIFNACGFKCGVIGTVNIRYPGKIEDNPITTPDAIILQQALAQMKAAGVTHVIMEVSSHGLAQHRVDGCSFSAGIFTNLTQDHLDYHPDMEAYFSCKKSFFTDFIQPQNAFSVINTDDDYGRRLHDTISGAKKSVGTSSKADIRAQDIHDDIAGLTGTLVLENDRLGLVSALTGRFNLENILCAAGAAHVLGIAPEKIRQGLESCSRIPGRLEKVPNAINRHIFADYAHTPDALKSILTTLKERAPKRLITVFGCGGDRDRTKRGPMGKIACKYSDLAIVTSDNPRTEDPDRIVQDIVQGIREDSIPEVSPGFPAPGDPAEFKKGFMVHVDRKKALEKAVMVSRPQDIIVAAGKGHETYQITNAGTIHFDDREELHRACRAFESRFRPMPWSLDDLAHALGQAPLVSSLKEQAWFSKISTDSRTIRQDQVFLALKGENFDAHKFIPDLVQKGIKVFVAQENLFSSVQIETLAVEREFALFQVGDTLAALGCLARYQRLRTKARVVGITGSNGKTSTRKITQSIFGNRFHTLATQGNLNNEIGVPLTLLNLSEHHEWAVVEMGMNHAGEMSRLSRMVCPDIAVITNTSGAHLEGLGTPDNVARAKAEIFEHAAKNATAVIFGDDPRIDILVSAAQKNPDISNIILFGTQDRADLRAESIEINHGKCRFKGVWEKQTHSFVLPSPAPFMVNNCLGAIAAAKTAGIGGPDMEKGVLSFRPVSGRMDIMGLSNGVTLIDDTYNANPASVSQALETLARQARGKKALAVLGDMLELGDKSEDLHYSIGKKAAGLGLSRLYLFGPQSRFTLKGALENGMDRDALFHGSKEEIGSDLVKTLAKGDWILVKGSRGMAMESLIPLIKTPLDGKADPDASPNQAKEIQ